MKWSLLVLLLLILPSINALMLEQRIDITNALHSTTSTSWFPTNGNTGIVEVDLSKYDNVSAIYFETTSEYDYLGIPNGVGCGSVGLYDLTNGTQINEATVGVGGGPGFHSSGNNLTYLFNNSVIQVTPNMIACVQSQVNLYHARLIIIQEGTINKTRTYIPIGMNTGTTSNCVGGGPDPENIYPKKWIWTNSDFGGTVTLTHAGTIHRSGGMFGTRAAYANVANTTNDILSAQLTTTNTVPTYVEASLIALQDNSPYYGTLCKSLFASQAIERNAFIIVDQEGLQEDLNITLVYQMENTQRIESGVGYYFETSQQTQYNGTRLQGYNLDNFTYDATFKTQAFSGTEYALAILRFDGVNINPSVLSTTSTSPVELRKSIDFSSYQSSDDTLRTGVQNLDSGTNVVVWSGRLLVKINGLEKICWDYNEITRTLSIPTGCNCSFPVAWGEIFAV